MLNITHEKIVSQNHKMLLCAQEISQAQQQGKHTLETVGAGVSPLALRH